MLVKTCKNVSFLNITIITSGHIGQIIKKYILDFLTNYRNFILDFPKMLIFKLLLLFSKKILCNLLFKVKILTNKVILNGNYIIYKIWKNLI